MSNYITWCLSNIYPYASDLYWILYSAHHFLNVSFSSCWFFAERFSKKSLWLFVSVSFLLPPAAGLPISPLSTSLLHRPGYISLTLVHRCTFGLVTDCLVCVCAGLSPSQLKKIACTLKELLKAFCQCAGGLKAKRSLQRWWRFYLIGRAFFPDTSSCLTSQPFHLDTRRSHLNTTKCLERGGGRGCLKRWQQLK